MGGNSDIELIKNGKRLDGRAANQLREISIEVGVLKNADGSCLLKWGKNIVLAGVFGPRECFPKHTQDPLKAKLFYRYNMAPFSTEDRKRPGPDRRSTEISKVSREALERVMMLEYFPKTEIDVFVEVLQAGAGTRCAALTAASVAVADAGIPMKDLVACCAAGKINDTIVLDLEKAEDNFGQADLPIGYVPSTKEVVLLQMDGNLSKDEFDKAFEMAVGGCIEVYELQRKALKDRYKSVAEEVYEEAEAGDDHQTGE
ncbi:MAG: exosome complex exonuclease Rrp41 [Candidatus Micrarchaeota archaeon]